MGLGATLHTRLELFEEHCSNPLPHSPHAVPGVPPSDPHPPQAFCATHMFPLGHDCAGHPQAPPAHVWLDEHFVAHVPQLFASVVVLTQAFPHGW